MPAKPEQSFYKDRRVIVVGIGGSVVGFLLAALIFGKPWHLPPAWGDIPTWLTAVVGGVAAWFVLSQLRQQQAVLDEDRERGRKRDTLLDGQLREMTDRERERQREQAERVALTGPRISPGISGEARRMLEQRGPLPKGALPSGSFDIVNSSGRPVRRVAARLIIEGTQLLPNGFRQQYVGEPFPGRPSVSQWFDVPDGAVDLTLGEYLHLLAGITTVALFTIPWELENRPTRFVVRFTDDADRRWELDQDMHLAPAPDELW